MASKNIRIRDWATQNGLQNKDVIAALDEFGFPGKTASSNLPQEAMERLIGKFNLKPAEKAASGNQPAQPQKEAKSAPKKQDAPPPQPKPQPQTQVKQAAPAAQPKPQAPAQSQQQKPAAPAVQPRPQVQAPV